MDRFVRLLLAFASVASVSAGCRGAERAGDGQVLVFAAASLEDALTEVAAAYRASGGGAEVELNTAGSNVLAQQIRAGAPADVFVSADARWVDELIAEKRLDADTRRELLGNRLVVVAHPAAGHTLARLEDLGRLEFRHFSAADPDAVPAGRYARSLLETTLVEGGGTVWEAVADRLAPAPDVRAALALVAAEPNAVGIVYASDVVAAREVQVLLEIEREPDPPIRYVAALVSSRGEGDGGRGPASEARRFLEFIGSEAALATFERHGFLALRAPRSTPR